MELLGRNRAGCAAIVRRARCIPMLNGRGLTRSILLYMTQNRGCPPVSQNGCCGYGLPTFADPVVNGQIAPTPDFRETAVGLACKVFSGHSASGTDPPNREHVVARADRGMIHHGGRSPTRCANVPYA